MRAQAPRAPKDSVRPRRCSGGITRPLSFTVRTQMPGAQPRREKVASAVAGAMGAASFALALWFFRARQPYITLWLFGGAFGLFSSALAPQRLFLSVTAPLQQRLPLPRSAKLCVVLSCLCFLLGVIAWVGHLS